MCWQPLISRCYGNSCTVWFLYIGTQALRLRRLLWLLCVSQDVSKEEQYKQGSFNLRKALSSNYKYTLVYFPFRLYNPTMDVKQTTSVKVNVTEFICNIDLGEGWHCASHWSIAPAGLCGVSARSPLVMWVNSKHSSVCLQSKTMQLA